MNKSNKPIAYYRLLLRLTVEQLLALTGWSIATYKRTRSGKRKLTKLERIGLDSLVKERKNNE